MNPPEVVETEGRGPRLCRAWGSRPRALRAALPLLLAIPVVGLWLYLAPNSGGYFPRDWYPAAILAVALAIVVGLATGRALPGGARRPRGAGAAGRVRGLGVRVAPLGRLDRERARGRRTSCSSSWRWPGRWRSCPGTPASARWLLGAWSLGLAVVAVVSLAGASGTARPQQVPLRVPLPAPDRLRERQRGAGRHRDARRLRAVHRPRRRTRALAGLFLAVAALLADFALLSQSRGSFIGVAVATPVFLVFAPDRLRVGTAPARPRRRGGARRGPDLDVYDTGEVGGALGARPGRRGGGDRALRARGRRRRAAARRWRSEPRAGTSASRPPAGAPGSRAWPCWRSRSWRWRSSTSAASPTRWTSSGPRSPAPSTTRWRARGSRTSTPTSAPTTGGWRSTSSRSRPWPAWAPATSSASTRRAGTSPSTRATCTTCSCGRSARAASWARPCSWRSSCPCSWPGRLLRRRLARAPALVLATALAIAAYFAVHLNFDWLEEIPAVASPALALPLVALWPPRGRRTRESAAGSPRAPRARGPGWRAALAAVALLGRSCRPTCRCAT